MKNDITIKQILLKDLDYEKAADLIREAFKGLLNIGINSPTAQITAKELIKRNFDYCFCVYIFSDELIGIALLKDKGKKLYLDICAVKKDYQGHGIAKQIFALVDNIAKENKYECIYLDTMELAISNIKLYEYLGYKKVDFASYTNNYFSIEFYKYGAKNKVRDIIIFLKFNFKKFYIKKIIYKSPKEMTKFGLLLMKIKKFIRKNVFKK